MKKMSQLLFSGVYYCKLCKFNEKSNLLVAVWAFKSFLFYRHLSYSGPQTADSRSRKKWSLAL